MQNQNCKYLKNKHKKDTCVVRYQVICSSVGRRGEISGAHLCRFQFYTKAFSSIYTTSVIILSF